MAPVDVAHSTPLKNPPNGGVTAYAVFVCCFASIAGFLHGYDNGVLGQVQIMDEYQQVLGWNSDTNVAVMSGLVVNAFNVCAAISAMMGGHLLVDKYGRKPGLVLGSALFGIGGAVQTFANGMALMLIGRAIAGLGVGITSSAGTAYISEVSPASIRGMMVGVYQANVCIGILFASILNWFTQDMHNGWRYSLSVQIILGLVVCAGLVCLDESPRFLESAGKTDEAFRVMTKFRGGNEEVATAELDLVKEEIRAEAAAGSASWSEVFTNPFFRNVVVIGGMVQFFQIITGINAMVTFGGTLFDSLGYNNLFAQIGPNTFFLIGSLIGSFTLVDRMGRRPLLIAGMTTMGLSLIIGGAIDLVGGGAEHLSHAEGMTIIAMVCIFMFAFGISWGFGAWVYIPEIMPLRVRAKGIGVASAMNWGPANVLNAILTPLLIDNWLGAGGTLLVYGVVSLITVLLPLTCMPETKGRSLEDVAPLFHFSDRAGFGRFVRGNLRGGHGCEDITQ